VVSLIQEQEKPTKSAIKKANRLARLERKQRQKLKQGNEQQQPVTPTTLPQPVTPVILEEGSSRSSPLLVPSSLPSRKAQPLTQDPVPAVSFDAPPIGTITTEDPPTITSTKVPVPEVKENFLEKHSPRNGSAANQVSRPDPETAKKRQNVLTRTLWTFIMIGGFIGNYPRTKCSQIYPLIFSMQVCCSLDMPT
jgi:phosphatidate cytidylyltransferase